MLSTQGSVVSPKQTIDSERLDAPITRMTRQPSQFDHASIMQVEASRLNLMPANSLASVVEAGMNSNWGTLHDFLSPNQAFNEIQHNHNLVDDPFFHGGIGLQATINNLTANSQAISKPTLNMIQDLARNDMSKQNSIHYSTMSQAIDDNTSMMGFPKQPYRKHQDSVSSLISPNFLSQIKTRYQDGMKDQAYVFKPVRKMIVRPGDRSNYKSIKSKSTHATSGFNNSRSANGQLYAFAGGASMFEDSLLMADPMTQNSIHISNPFASQKQMNITSSRDPVKFQNSLYLQSPQKVFFSTQTSPRDSSPLPTLEKEKGL